MYTVLLDQGNKDSFLHLTEPALADAFDDPSAFALGAAEEDDTAAGVLICRMRGAWADIVWLYADPRFRGRGVGHLLLRQLLSALLAQPGIDGVFAEYADVPENILLTRLFAGCAFLFEDEQKALCELSLAEAARAPFLQRDMDDARVISLENTDERQWKVFQAELAENAQPVATALPIDRRAYHPRLSLAFTDDGKIGGVLLMREDAGALELSYLHVLPGSENALGPILYKAGRLAAKTYPPHTRVRFAPVSEPGEKIAEKLFPTLKKTPFLRAHLWTAGTAGSLKENAK
jgi:GNAT superfamily N-acetyltransferase